MTLSSSGEENDRGLPTMESRVAIMPSHKESNFLDVCCNGKTVYCVTSNGVLCTFDTFRMMEKWVSLETEKGYALSVTDEYVGVACSNGVVRLFHPGTLQYISTLPMPPALGCANELDLETHEDSVSATGKRFPNACCIQVSNTKVVIAYSDRSVLVFDIRDPYNVGLCRSYLFHSGCIWDVQVAGTCSSNIPANSFVTCSADNTVRVWNLTLNRSKGKADNGRPDEDEMNAAKWKNPYCNDLLRIIYADPVENFQRKNVEVLGGTCSQELDNEIPAKADAKAGIRTIAIDFTGSSIACGNKVGMVSVYDVESKKIVSEQLAHESEVLCLSYSPPRKSGLQMLASGSRDRLIHVFDANKNYQLKSTLDDHSAAITAVKYSTKGDKILSCGGDKTLVISNIDANDNIVRDKSVAVPYGTIYDMDVDATDKYIVTAGKDKRLNIWNVSTGKHERSYTASHDDEIGELFRVHMDPAGIFASTASLDKWIRLFDFFSGDCIAKVTGHSELITGIKFTADCSRLISVSADGCIFVWRLADELSEAMKDRLSEISKKAAHVTLPTSVHPTQSEIAHPPAPPAYVRPVAPAKLNAADTKSESSILPPAPPSDVPDWAKTKKREEFASTPITSNSESKLSAPEKASIPLWARTSSYVRDTDTASEPANIVNVANPIAKVPLWARTSSYMEDEFKDANTVDSTSDTNTSTSLPQSDTRWSRVQNDDIIVQNSSICPDEDDGVLSDRSALHLDMDVDSLEDDDPTYLKSLGPGLDLPVVMSPNLSSSAQDHEGPHFFSSPEQVKKYEELSKSHKNLYDDEAKESATPVTVNVEQVKLRSSHSSLYLGTKKKVEEGSIGSLSASDTDVRASTDTNVSLREERDAKKKKSKHKVTTDALKNMKSTLLNLGVIKHKKKSADPDTSTKNSVDSSGSAKIEPTLKVTDSIDFDVNTSYSQFTEGFSNSNKPKVVDSFDFKVNESLSQFTEGFSQVDAPSVADSFDFEVMSSQSPTAAGNRENDIDSQIASLPVSPPVLTPTPSTLGPAPTPSNADNVPIIPVAPSGVTDSIDFGVNTSFSQFTSGYSDASTEKVNQPALNHSVVNQSIEFDPLQSYSNFVSGYQVANGEYHEATKTSTAENNIESTDLLRGESTIVSIHAQWNSRRRTGC